MSKFKFLIGDVNYLTYGGKWHKQVSDTCYHVITLVNMWDATGDENQDKYDVQLEEIDLAVISQENIDAAISCYGFSDEDIEKITPLMTVEAISDYGCFAFMGHWMGNNFKKLWDIATNESRSLANEEYHDSRMNRTVNKIGSTAREAMQGDFISAMIRGIARGDKNARIMGKMHGLKDEDMNPIEGNDDYKNFGL